jgi:hypothetical protein
MSGNIGARRVMAVAAAIEDAARRRKIAPEPDAMARLAAEIGSACAALAESRFAA